MIQIQQKPYVYFTAEMQLHLTLEKYQIYFTAYLVCNIWCDTHCKSKDLGVNICIFYVSFK